MSGSEGGTQKRAAMHLAGCLPYHYFPPSYAQATWKRLLPFFQLSGTITQDATLVQVELCPFNDRVLNRDLALLCDRINQASPRLAFRASTLLHHPFLVLHSCCAEGGQNTVTSWCMTLSYYPYHQ
jgi:hypothetical protein